MSDVGKTTERMSRPRPDSRTLTNLPLMDDLHMGAAAQAIAATVDQVIIGDPMLMCADRTASVFPQITGTIDNLSA